MLKFNQFKDIWEIDYHFTGPCLEFVETENYIRDREEENKIK